MRRQSVETLIRALHNASVRYLIAGGLAVVAHGYGRMTADVDLIVDLEEGNVRRFLAALAALGYRPRAPVPLEQFADEAARRKWISEKGLLVFSLHSPAFPDAEVDVFTESPLDFAKAYSVAHCVEIATDLPATFVSFQDLAVMKQQAGRPQDLADLEQLTRIKEQMARDRQ